MLHPLPSDRRDAVFQPGRRLFLSRATCKSFRVQYAIQISRGDIFWEIFRGAHEPVECIISSVNRQKGVSDTVLAKITFWYQTTQKNQLYQR